MTKHIYSLNELNEKLPWGGKKTVLVGGCFDVLHYGHILFLENAKKQGDVLVVALESDEFIRLRKERAPVHTQAQRAHILTCLHFVDYVVQLSLLNGDAGYAELVRTVKPAVIAVTENDPYIKVKEEHAQSVGAHVQQVAPLVEPFSSTQILSYESILSS